MTFGFVRVLREDDGVAVVEYSLITAAVSIIALASIQMTGFSLNTLYGDLVASWSSAAESGQ